MGFLDRIHQRLELFRLERRYTRNRDRRTTFVSNAIYVDGEYVYNTPANTGSSANSVGTTSTRAVPALHASRAPAPTSLASLPISSPGASTPDQTDYAAAAAAASRRPKSWSAMPGLGSTSMPSEMPHDWRTSRLG